MTPTFDTGLVWLRRDLRTEDNAALYYALKKCRHVHCAFVFDTEILDALPRQDRRIEFIRESLVALDARLREWANKAGAGLIVLHGVARREIPALAKALGADAVFANRDYEPSAIDRDDDVNVQLKRQGAALHLYKDQTIFDTQELLTKTAKPYAVFTPYKNAWLEKVDAFYLKAYPVKKHALTLAERPRPYRREVPTLAALKFKPANFSELSIPCGETGGAQMFDDFLTRIQAYDDTRNFPAVHGCSGLSVHLRFGTVSIRTLAAKAHALSARGNPGAAVWLSELIWRDFYFQILCNSPHVGQGKSYKPAYDAIQWEQGAHAQTLFDAWCEGRTGYPLVDAAMAQINQTGYMHNRLRMLTACFLIKDLGIDWRWGERYFAERLNDYDLSANNGGWQWASSSGCDAQPYFRIFNPITQSMKFDAQGVFIRQYLPQLAKLSNRAIHSPWTATKAELQAAEVALDQNYPRPVVDHAAARAATLERYAVVKAKPKT